MVKETLILLSPIPVLFSRRPKTQPGGGALNSDSVDAIDTGDIIISSAPDKPKLSRPLLLGIIVGVLILVGGAVAAVILLAQQKSSGSTPTVTKVNDTTLVTSDDYKDSFLLYANYILTGVASTDPLPAKYDGLADYYIWNIYAANSVGAIDIASVYLENFNELYKAANSADGETQYAIDYYLGQFNSVKSYIEENANDDRLVDMSDMAYLRMRYAQNDVVEKVWEIWGYINV